MDKLTRLGDIIDLETEFHKDDETRIIQEFDNMALADLFLERNRELPDYYVSSTKEQYVPIRNMPPNIKSLGGHERNILNKILKPQYPVICIYGRMGSGKSTTIQLIIDHIIRKMDCSTCKKFETGEYKDCKRIIARIDFKFTLPDPTTGIITFSKLVDDICDRLWNKCSIYMRTPSDEYQAFWKYLKELNDKNGDEFIEKVFGSLSSNIPYLRYEIEKKSQNIDLLQTVKDKLRKSDKEWYLRYLILMWRYLLQTQFINHQECIFVVLDNVDSLPTKIQRDLVSFVQKSAYLTGPTFILLIREETLRRVGINDIPLDQIEHLGPEPIRVLLHRIERFNITPDEFLESVPTLTDEDSVLFREFLARTEPKLHDDEVFINFIKNIAGKSIRNALLLSQGLFELTIGEMKRVDLSSRYIIRAMLRNKGHQFRASPQSHVVNPFDVPGEKEGRYLTKIRILKFIERQGGECKSQKLISVFNNFGFMSPDIVWNAVRDMVRNECQLLTSDGYDPTYSSWGDDQDTLSITEIGRGYIDYLIYDVDFIGEVMLDARVSENFRLPDLYRDRLNMKLDILYTFLTDIHESDMIEVRRFKAKAFGAYNQLFEPRLLTLDIIQGIYLSIGKLMQSQKTRHPDRKEEYIDIMGKFTSILRMIEKNNHDLFGVTDRIIPNFVFK